jgi:hypothetical protein
MICSSFNPPFELLLTHNSLRKQILESQHNTPGTMPATSPNSFVMAAPDRRPSERESGESLPVTQISQIEGNVLSQRPWDSSMSSVVLSEKAQLELWLQLCTCSPADFIDLCSSILGQLADGHREMTELLTLRHMLDIDCIQRLDHDVVVLQKSRLSVALVMRVVEALSVRLTDYHGPDSPRRREWQFRALLSALTLLTYHKVTHLSDTTLGKLERACGQLNQDAYYAAQVASDELRDGTCMYLVRLISDYIKFFKSDQPIVVTIFSRVLNVAFAAANAYQYNGPAVVVELDSAFRTLRARRQDKYKALGSLTELTRTIKIIYLWGLAEDRSQLDDLAYQLAKLAVEHTIEILNSDPQLELQSQPGVLWRIGESVAANLARSSNLDSFSYMIGLLDNLAQIAQMFPVRSESFLSKSLSPDYTLSLRLWRLMATSNAVQFHLKAIEIMLAFHKERADNTLQLQDKAQSLPREQQTALVNHINQVRKSLDDHDKDAGSSWLFLRPRLLTALFQPPVPCVQHEQGHITAAPLAIDSGHSEDEGHALDGEQPPPSTPNQPLSPQSLLPELLAAQVGQHRRTTSTGSGSPVGLSTPPPQRGRSSSDATPSLTHGSSASANPEALPRMQFVAFEKNHGEPFTYRYPLERGKLGIRRKNYFAVGISPSCQFVFFLGETYASVFRLCAQNLNENRIPPVLEIRAPKKTIYLAAALGDDVFAVITSDDCRIYSLATGDGGLRQPQMICSPITNEEWEPCSVGISGRYNNSAILALGWKRGLNPIAGQIELYNVPSGSCSTTSHANYLESFYTLNLCRSAQGKDLDEDYAKSISFSPDAKYLTATSQRFNIVYVWILQNIPTINQFQETSRVFIIRQICRTHREFSQEPGVEGVSSTTIFPTPFQDTGPQIPPQMSLGSASISTTSAAQSPTHYILCTTSPSSERKYHQGLEYPFLSPLLSPFPLDDSPLFHCITAFVRDPHLQASAVPESGNVVALLKRSGNIVIVPFLNVAGRLKTPSTPKGTEPTDGLVRIEARKEKSKSEGKKEKLKLKANLMGREGAMAWVTGADGVPRLIAVDCEGLLVVVGFEGDKTKLVPRTDLDFGEPLRDKD